jgi:signal peptidase I
MEDNHKPEEVKNPVELNSEISEHTGQENVPKIKKRKALVANILNYLAPGLGLFYAGKIKQGIIIGLIWPFVLLCLSILFLSISFVLYCFVVPVCAIAFFVSLFIYTASICKKKNDYTLRKFNRVYVYLLYIVVYLVYTSPLVEIPIKAFRIPTGSMENTLLAGDYIMVNKTAYGIIMPYTGAKIINGAQPQRYDVVTYWMRMEKEQTPYIHRVIGLPGDTIKIVSKAVYINGKLEEQLPGLNYDKINRDKDYINKRMYPGGAPWNEDFYGPLFIPKKGDVINLETENKEIWRELIIKDALSEGEENPEGLLNKKEYVLKNNYFFLMGDNRNNALDSRYTGLVSEDDIFGKASIIYFNKVYLDRIGKTVK